MTVAEAPPEEERKRAPQVKPRPFPSPGRAPAARRLRPSPRASFGGKCFALSAGEDQPLKGSRPRNAVGCATRQSRVAGEIADI